jgi:hypothetical protein
VDVAADTGRTVTLRIAPPAGSVWLARVAERRAEPVASGGAPLNPPPPVPEPGALPAELPAPPEFEIEANLQPPALIASPPLRVPPGAGPASVELDVHVDESGGVAEVAWAGGSHDPALFGAASACARGMSFRPATRGGRPVAVWCRQRFDFGTPR